MKKVKISEASVAMLNWLVAVSLGWKTVDYGPSWYLVKYPTGISSWHSEPQEAPAYCTDWSLLMPIIDKENIGLLPEGTAVFKIGEASYYHYGATKQIALVRAYLMKATYNKDTYLTEESDVVLVPDELN